MTKVSLGLAALAACLAAAACSEKTLTLSEGAASTLSVRVYVDADGDGTFDAATDVPIADITVSATPSGGGGGDVSEMTDASGIATFELAPGSYTLSAAGTVPSGAVLATASSPAVVAPFQGAQLTSEFRYTFNPGQLSIVVFRDDNGSGTFEPGVDTPAPGVGAELASGSDIVGTGTTDATGTVEFQALRPGEYTLTLTPLPTIDLVGGNTRTIVIEAAAATDLAVEFTGDLVIPIADARAAAVGSVVAVEGVITWQTFRSNLDAYVQDGTGGIAMFEFSLDPTPVTEGDSVRVIGEISEFNGDLQISPVTSLEVLGSTSVPAPRIVSAAEINAGDFQGELVVIDGIVDSLQVFSFDNHNVWLSDAAGDDAQVFVDSRVGVGSADWMVGELYAVLGVLSTDNRNAFPYRVELRGPGDMILGGSAVTLAEARGMPGETVTVVGVLSWQAEFQTSRLEGFMQDGTAGIALFDFGVDPTGLQRGDTIRVRGTVGSFRSEVQISSVDVFSVIAGGPPPTPRAVTATEINAFMFQGELVTISGTVDSLQVDGFDNALVFLTDGGGETFNVFSDSRTGVASTTWTIGQTFQVTGPLGRDDRNVLEARVEVRDPNDVQ